MKERPPLKQPTPADLIKSVSLTIREKFCPNMTDKEWYKDHFPMVRRLCIVWPAKFVVEKHFTLPADRFKGILLNVMLEAKREARQKIDYAPAYLGHCVQTHFKIHWEEYYRESKSIALRAEEALIGLGKLPTAQDKTVETLAMLQKAIKSPGGKKKVEKNDGQFTFGL